jgi:2-dehydro-3-deoxyglucarate aldolase|tara:strand:- start:587 stop:1264 length:678 start_codon:yes stop_codon:yes gene_type:complete
MKLSWQQIPSTIISEMLCEGFDGVVIDTEHGCFNNETLYNCIQIITAKNKTCLVRLTEINKTLIRMCLDAGASGLIFSTVEDATQAAKIKELCTYPKYGGKRGLGLVRQNKWGYSTLVNKPPIIIAQIETKRAVHNLEEIYAQGLDHYMIGPYDLSASLGVTAEFDNPKFLEAIKTINKVITDPSKMAVHIPTDVNKHIDKYAEYAIIAVGMDTTILLEGYKELV